MDERRRHYNSHKGDYHEVTEEEMEDHGGLSHETTPRGWSNERLSLVLRHVTANNEITDMEEWNLTIDINQINSCLSCDIAIMMN